jgi:hypothetical protein
MENETTPLPGTGFAILINQAQFTENRSARLRFVDCDFMKENRAACSAGRSGLVRIIDVFQTVGPRIPFATCGK